MFQDFLTLIILSNNEPLFKHSYMDISIIQY